MCICVPQWQSQAKWSSVSLRTKWLWLSIPLLSQGFLKNFRIHLILNYVCEKEKFEEFHKNLQKKRYQTEIWNLSPMKKNFWTSYIVGLVKIVWALWIRFLNVATVTSNFMNAVYNNRFEPEFSSWLLKKINALAWNVHIYIDR